MARWQNVYASYVQKFVRHVAMNVPSIIIWNIVRNVPTLVTVVQRNADQWLALLHKHLYFIKQLTSIFAELLWWLIKEHITKRCFC